MTVSACLCLFFAMSLSATGQDYRTNIPAVTSNRWTVSVPPLPSPTNITRAAYYSYIQSVYNIYLAERVLSHAGNTNESQQFSFAYYTTFFYKATGDPAWYDLAMRCIRGDMANMTAGGAGGYVLPARVAWLLHDTPLMLASTNDQQTLHDWMIQTEPSLSTWFEVKGTHFEIPVAMFRECILGLWPNEPGNTERQAYVSQVWSNWHEVGDLTLNSAGYEGLILGYMMWWLDIRGASEYQETEAMEKLAYRHLEYATPLGCLPHFGDGVGWNSSPDLWMPVWERWATAYGDGRFRWVAQRQFQWTTARDSDMWQWGNINYSLMTGLMDAWLYANDSITPLPPTSSSVATTRKVHHRCTPSETAATGCLEYLIDADMPDKVIFRDGWQPGDTYAMVELNPFGVSHGHNDSGSINCFVSQGSVLLHAPPYQVKDHQFHNCLIVEQLTPPSTNTYAPWWFGVSGILTTNLPATTNNPQSLVVSFDAKSLSGSRYLQVLRPAGGGASDPFEITPDWQHYQSQFDVGYGTPSLYFNPVNALTGGVIVDGEFLLDNMRISRATDGVPQNENLFKNPDFETSITDWSGADTRVMISRETADTSGGSQGSLRAKVDVNQYAAEETHDVRLVEFHQGSNVACARVEMRRYNGKDVDVTRRVFFLADKGLWVKDTVEAVADLEAEVGPAWHFTSIYGPQGSNWINACQVTVPVSFIGDPYYLMQWSNRPIDTLVWFGATAGAQMTTNDVTFDRTREIVNQDLMNTTKWRVWQRLAGTLPTGSTQAFSSVLMPHVPMADASPLANSISLLKDTPDVSILQITDTQTDRQFVFGMNDNGTPLDIDPYGIKTDAKWFKVVFSAGTVEDYWQEQGTYFIVAFAADSTWINDAGGTYSVAGNWDNGVPGAADTASFDNSAEDTFTVSFSANATNTKTEFFGDAPDDTITFNLGGNTLTVEDDFRVGAATAAQGATHANVSMTNGTMNITNLAGTASLTVCQDTFGQANSRGSLTLENVTVNTHQVNIDVGTASSVTGPYGLTVGSGAVLNIHPPASVSTPLISVGAGGTRGFDTFLVVTDGGIVDAVNGTGAPTSLFVARNSRIVVSGSGSSLSITNNDILFQPVNDGAAGSTGSVFRVEDGGSATLDRFLIGGKSNLLHVTGNGSTFSYFGQESGHNVRGSYNRILVEDGAEVTCRFQLHVENQVGNSCTISGADTVFTVVDRLRVEDLGSPSIIVSDGALLSVGADTHCGQGGSTHATILVTGSGSVWTNVGNIQLPAESPGIQSKLTISDGGAVYASDIYPGGKDPNYPGATGTVEIVGSGSLLSVSSSMVMTNAKSGDSVGVLDFTADAAGLGQVVAGGTVWIDANDKLIVDITDYAYGNGLQFVLVDCAFRAGSFDAGNITITTDPAASAVVDQTTYAPDIVLDITPPPKGLLTTIQ